MTTTTMRYQAAAHDLIPGTPGTPSVPGDPSAPVLLELVVNDTQTVTVNPAAGATSSTTSTSAASLAAAARLVLLTWCRDWMPVATSPELWRLEAAALAADSGSSALIQATSTALEQAVGSLGGPAWKLPASLRDLVMASQSDPTALQAAVLQLREWLPGRQPLTRPFAIPQPPSLSLRADRWWFDVEWDRVSGCGVDPRELVGRADIDGTAWTVAIPAQAGTKAEGHTLLARIVDNDTAAVVAQQPLQLAHGVLTCAGFMPTAPPARWRIEVTAEPQLPPRNLPDWTLQSVQQALFRALLAARHANNQPHRAAWRDAAWQRAQRRLRVHHAADPAALLTLPAQPPAHPGLPFLAEQLIDPGAISRRDGSHEGVESQARAAVARRGVGGPEHRADAAQG